MLQQLEDALVNGDLDDRWTSSLETWDTTPVERAQALALVAQLRDQFIEAARDIEDEDELPTTAALEYIQLKSRWYRLNTQMNYQLFKQGEASPDVQYQGTLVSQLLAEIEPFIDPQDVSRITQFLTDPIIVPV
ncbi:MAG: hypothetical protein AAGI71_02965 [Bacteroidota bacterium]